MDDFATDKPPIPLSNATLRDLPTSVKRPSYDRANLTPGIVHIGLGNFHRAHQAWYLHRLMEQGLAHDWAIVGAGVRPNDAAMRARLMSQDCLTTLIELDPAGTSLEVIGSMIDFLPIEENNASLIAMMADPRIRIVSLTVTEGGYFVDAASGAFETGHPDIRHDAARPETPRTAFGAAIAALARRRAAGTPPFTLQSCDNLQGNGDILRQTIVSLARLSDAALADWIDTHVAFPNSMVDCIVPATGAAEIDLARRNGVDDAAPVTHENYRQWVSEDDFCAGRPAWERVGATLTSQVHAYEKMKIRVLNAGHQVLANVGELLSHETIADCMGDAEVAAFFHKVQSEEILPYVEPVPDISPDDYLERIERRFANPAIRDTTRRVAFDGSSRHSGFVLPIIRDALAIGGSVSGLALVEALWARMCTGNREDGSTIEANDPYWDELLAAAQHAATEPTAWLKQKNVYGDLARSVEFVDAFSEWRFKLESLGVRNALKEFLEDARR